MPSLSLPRPEADAVDDVGASDAVRLFVDRAQAHDPGFVLDDASAPLLASVSRRLDGIPLALELAAARLSSMSLQQVSDRLGQRFRLLTGGSRNAMPRQQTLQAAVDWSFGLLTEPERDLLRRLSVFAGGFELDASEAICTADSVDPFDVLDLLGSLVSKSLVAAERTPESVRYWMLETIRQYAAQELLRSGGEAHVVAVRDGHAGYSLRLAEEAAPALAGPGQGHWLRRLDTEWENLSAAASHLAAEGRTDDVLRLGVWLQRFADQQGTLRGAHLAAERGGVGRPGAGHPAGERPRRDRLDYPRALLRMDARRARHRRAVWRTRPGHGARSRRPPPGGAGSPRPGRGSLLPPVRAFSGVIARCVAIRS